MSPCLPQGSHAEVTYEPYSSPRDVRRGDIILFSTEIEGNPADVAWRVIGLPLEHVVSEHPARLTAGVRLAQRVVVS